MNVQRLLDVIAFATRAHAGQVRKYSGEPYMVHPIAVAKLVEQYWAYATEGIVVWLTLDERQAMKNTAIAAALLHDVVEDTHVSLTEISLQFGLVVANLVNDLTKKTKKEDGNRATRCKMERERLAKCDPISQFIKICDLMDNTKDIAANDQKFAKTYLQEKLDLLQVLLPGTQFNADVTADVKALLQAIP